MKKQRSAAERKIQSVTEHSHSEKTSETASIKCKNPLQLPYYIMEPKRIPYIISSSVFHASGYRGVLGLISLPSVLPRYTLPCRVCPYPCPHTCRQGYISSAHCPPQHLPYSRRRWRSCRRRVPGFLRCWGNIPNTCPQQNINALKDSTPQFFHSFGQYECGHYRATGEPTP